MQSPLFRRRRYWRNVAGSLASERGGSIRAIRWLAMYALGRILIVRRIARFLARRTALLEEGVSAVFAGGPALAAEIAATVDGEGFDIRLRLPAAMVEELASAAAPGRAASVPFASASAPCPAMVEKIARDPMLLSIAARYLGGRPAYQGSRIWWTRPSDDADPLETGARFHFDLYDYRALTFLFYLTDVDPESAPHVCVRRSHRSRRWRDQFHPRRHRSDERVSRLYGEDRMVTICGPAGTGIAEDPFCFHKVKLPAKGFRLALQLLYTGNEVPAPSFSRVAGSPPSDAPRSRGKD